MRAVKTLVVSARSCAHLLFNSSHRHTGKHKGKDDVGGDTARNVRREPEVFNEYVKPEAEGEWCPHATAIHHLTPEHPSITSAGNIATVWAKFEDWISRKVAEDEKVILVAWHGGSCDLKWLWHLTQAPGTSLHLPEKIAFFLDPESVIRTKASCS